MRHRPQAEELCRRSCAQICLYMYGVEWDGWAWRRWGLAMMQSDTEAIRIVEAAVAKRCPDLALSQSGSATELVRRVCAELCLILAESGDPPDAYGVSFRLDSKDVTMCGVLRKALDRAHRR